jgi:hypothetical protein
MDVIRGLGVLIGVTLLGGCAAPAQREAATASSSTVYFESSDPAPSAAGTEFAGTLQWSRVDPRFRVNVDELAINVGNWARTGGRAGGAGPLLLQLADALEAMPRGERVGPYRDTAAIRGIAGELNKGSTDGAGQRRAARRALLLVQRQLAADANGTYAADPSLLPAVDELREASLAISDSAPDSAVELGFVTARDAMRAFELSLARGKVIPND